LHFEEEAKGVCASSVHATILPFGLEAIPFEPQTPLRSAEQRRPARTGGHDEGTADETDIVGKVLFSLGHLGRHGDLVIVDFDFPLGLHLARVADMGGEGAGTCWRVEKGADTRAGEGGRDLCCWQKSHCLDI